MEKCNNLFIPFFLLVMLQLNSAMNEELERSKMTSNQKNQFFYFDQKNNEIKIILKLKKEFEGEIKSNIVFSTFKKIVESLPGDRQAEDFDGYLEKYLYSLNQSSSKDAAKDGLNQSLLLKTKKQLDDIKENKEKYTIGALVLAVLTAGGYYFRQRIGRNIGKVKNYSRKAWNVAKQYVKKKAVNFK